MSDPILYGKGSCCRIYIDTQEVCTETSQRGGQRLRGDGQEVRWSDREGQRMTEQMARRSGCRVRSAMVRVDAAVLWENTTFKHRPCQVYILKC